MESKDLENGSSQGYDHANGADLRQVATASTIPPELFERLYLQPRNATEGQFRKTLANPTPIALMGFATGLTPLSIELMGWRGSGGVGAASATVGATIWFGGMLLLLAGLGEFLLGNTFPFLVFLGYGCHFLTFGTTFIPAFSAVSNYNDGNPYGQGSQMQTPAFQASFAFYPVAMAILSFIFLICSIRTNVVFFLIFVVATIGFGLAGGGFFQMAEGNMALGGNLIVGTGACFFVASILGWYMLCAIMFQIMELPFPALPIIDLSTKIRPKKQKE